MTSWPAYSVSFYTRRLIHELAWLVPSGGNRLKLLHKVKGRWRAVLQLVKSTQLFLLLLFSLPLFAQGPQPEPLTNQRIIQLVKSGTHADELIRLIATAPAFSFMLTPADTDQLTREGVSEETIKVMAARSNGNLSPTGQIRRIGERPRVFVNESPNSWSRGVSHPQTVEIMKTIAASCPNATVTNDRQRANYFVFLERESRKVERRDNKMVIFDQAGDLLYAASTRVLGNAVRNGCSFFR